MLPHQVRKKGTSAGQVDVCLGFNTAMADLSSKDGSFFCNYWLVATHIFLGICTPNLGEDEPILDERMFQMAGKKAPARQILYHLQRIDGDRHSSWFIMANPTHPPNLGVAIRNLRTRRSGVFVSVSNGDLPFSYLFPRFVCVFVCLE